MPQIRPPLDQTRDPGRVADVIAAYMVLPMSDKQSLLATLDPVIRLKRVDALMGALAPLSPTLEATWHRAFDHARQRNHQYATLEHLLLALLDDADASAVMRDCKADLGALKAGLISYLDNELKDFVTEKGGNARPTAAFERVAQRAASHAQGLGRPAVTGANTLLALFPKREVRRHACSANKACPRSVRPTLSLIASARERVRQRVPVAATLKQRFDAATSERETHAAF